MKFISRYFLIIIVAVIFVSCGSDKGLNPANGLGDDDVLKLTVSKISSSGDDESQTASTSISFNLPTASQWTVKIFGPTGYEIRSYSGNDVAGTVEVIWNGKNASGAAIKNGCYFFEVRARLLFARKLMIIHE